jgi:hypothetical protein
VLRFIIPAILTLGAAAPSFAVAKTVTHQVSGKRLDLRVSCPVRIEIQPRADLDSVIDVEAHAETPDALDALSFTSGDIATIENQRHCRFRDDDHRSLELTIHVPPGLPIDIDAVTAGTYKIGDIGGPLKLKLSGAGEVHAGRLSGLDFDSAGVAEIRVDRLDGPGTATLRGGGAVTIGGGNMTSLHLDSHGAGAITVESGEIGTLDLSLAGAGDAAIHARVQDATLKIFGIGNIEIKHVSGTVHREVHGIGNIDIGS